MFGLSSGSARSAGNGGTDVSQFDLDSNGVGRAQEKMTLV